MGTKTTTTSNSTQNIQRDPQAMTGYHQALTQAQSLVSNPFNNQFYNQNLGLLTGNANRQNQMMQQNTLSNLQRSGIGTGSAAGNMLRMMGGYMGSRNTAGAFNMAGQTAQSMYGSGMSMLSNPLVTGQTGNSTQTQQTSGLGTWLPQVIGAGLGAAGGFMGGGGFAGAMKGAMGMPSSGGGNAMGGFMGSVGGVANSALNSPQYMPSAGNWMPNPMQTGTYGYQPPIPQF